ncbi:MAG: hypothetical protein IJT49_03410 [Clostridia bacterium]|nr:hypothetical protein [Clostridia bacterium]
MKTITDTVKYLINDNTSTYDYVTEAIFIMIVLLREQRQAAMYLLRDNTGEIAMKIGNTTYIINEIFAENGRTVSDALKHLIIYTIEKEENEEKRKRLSQDEKKE